MGSPFASRVVKTLPIPFDPPHEVTLQKLAGRHLHKAEVAHQLAWLEDVEAKGGVKKQKERLRDWNEGDPKEPEPEPEPESEKKENEPDDPLAGVDPYTVCRFGIKSWTYDESLSVDADTQRVASLDDMDKDSLEWFATEIMRLTRPKLFQTKDEQKEAEKNDSAPSPTH